MRSSEHEILIDIIQEVKNLRPVNTDLYNSLMYIITGRISEIKDNK
jgi:hypothetical protein